MIYCAIILSILFLLSGIMSSSVLLIIASVLFAPSHIVISYKNVKWYLQIQVWRIEKIESYKGEIKWVQKKQLAHHLLPYLF